MRLVIDNTTRFFTVVGAPYLAERHADSDTGHGDSGDLREVVVAPPSASPGWWLRDDR
jgi:hypothetical protein